jgi:hypothetical protein
MYIYTAWLFKEKCPGFAPEDQVKDYQTWSLAGIFYWACYREGNPQQNLTYFPGNMDNKYRSS